MMAVDMAIELVGCPVKCRKCYAKGMVKPGTDYGGWYKSRFYRLQKYKWYCPEHRAIGEKVDWQFYESNKTPEPKLSTEDELYKLLD
jgi:hypothetical protein